MKPPGTWQGTYVYCLILPSGRGLYQRNWPQLSLQPPLQHSRLITYWSCKGRTSTCLLETKHKVCPFFVFIFIFNTNWSMVNLQVSLHFFSCTLFLFSSEPYMRFPGSFPFLNSPHPTAYIPLCARVISQLLVNRNPQHDTVPLTLNSSCANNELSICPPALPAITKYKHYFCTCFCWRIKFWEVTVLKVTSRWSVINLQGNFDNDLLTECCEQGTHCPKLFSDNIKSDFL